jgi:hypothetical protein
MESSGKTVVSLKMVRGGDTDMLEGSAGAEIEGGKGTWNSDERVLRRKELEVAFEGWRCEWGNVTLIPRPLPLPLRLPPRPLVLCSVTSGMALRPVSSESVVYRCSDWDGDSNSWGWGEAGKGGLSRWAGEDNWSSWDEAELAETPLDEAESAETPLDEAELAERALSAASFFSVSWSISTVDWAEDPDGFLWRSGSQAVSKGLSRNLYW